MTLETQKRSRFATAGLPQQCPWATWPGWTRYGAGESPQVRLLEEESGFLLQTSSSFFCRRGRSAVSKSPLSLPRCDSSSASVAPACTLPPSAVAHVAHRPFYGLLQKHNRHHIIFLGVGGTEKGLQHSKARGLFAARHS